MQDIRIAIAKENQPFEVKSKVLRVYVILLGTIAAMSQLPANIHLSLNQLIIGYIICGIIVLVLSIYLFQHHQWKFKASCLQIIYTLASQWAFLLCLWQFDNILAEIIAFGLIYLSSFVFMTKRKQILYLASIVASLITFDFLNGSLGVGFYFGTLGMCCLSFINSIFYTGINKLAKVTNDVLANSDQLLVELKQGGLHKIINSGFIDEIGFEKEFLISQIEKSFTAADLDFHGVLQRAFSDNEIVSHEIQVCNGTSLVGIKLTLLPIQNNGAVSKVMLLGSPSINNTKNGLTLTKVASEGGQRKISLPLLINCFKKDLSQSCENLEVVFKAENVEINENAFQAQDIFDHLSQFFKNEYEICSQNLRLTFTLHANEFVTSFIFSWKRPYLAFHFPDELRNLISENQGNLFNSTSEDGTSHLLFFLPNKETLESNNLELPKIESYSDYKFLDQLMSSIDKLVINTQFSVETLTKEMGVSRMQLHRKVKGMTGLSPGSLFQFIRMNRAERLLRSGEARISEIAYQLGYCDQSHFSKAFRAWFGVPPIQYLKAESA